MQLQFTSDNEAIDIGTVLAINTHHDLAHPLAAWVKLELLLTRNTLVQALPFREVAFLEQWIEIAAVRIAGDHPDPFFTTLDRCRRLVLETCAVVNETCKAELAATVAWTEDEAHMAAQFLCRHASQAEALRFVNCWGKGHYAILRIERDGDVWVQDPVAPKYGRWLEGDELVSLADGMRRGVLSQHDAMAA